MKCVICKDKEATQSHHIRYEPEITIEVCVPCHKRLHNYEVGVGRGRGTLPRSSRRELENIEISAFETPQFHYVTEEERVYETGTFEVAIYRSKATKEVLDKLTCHHCEKPGFGFFKEPSTDRLYLICYHCGYDLEIKRIG
ncbi:hypothetical protein ES705_48640 [subsurface metagenome]